MDNNMDFECKHVPIKVYQPFLSKNVQLKNGNIAYSFEPVKLNEMFEEY